jgi:hypothetical protein
MASVQEHLGDRHRARGRAVALGNTGQALGFRLRGRAFSGPAECPADPVRGVNDLAVSGARRDGIPARTGATKRVLLTVADGHERPAVAG